MPPTPCFFRSLRASRAKRVSGLSRFSHFSSLFSARRRAPPSSSPLWVAVTDHHLQSSSLHGRCCCCCSSRRSCRRWRESRTRTLTRWCVSEGREKRERKFSSFFALSFCQARGKVLNEKKKTHPSLKKKKKKKKKNSRPRAPPLTSSPRRHPRAPSRGATCPPRSPSGATRTKSACRSRRREPPSRRGRGKG